MKILFAIPNYYNPKGGGVYASLKPDPTPRIQALTQQIISLHQLFGQFQLKADLRTRNMVKVNEAEKNELSVVICTTKGHHLLDSISLPKDLWNHHATDAEPMLLGFECQSVLRDSIGRYDYYCFLEDDLILHDPSFFSKLKWFTIIAGESSLLQPNRYEIAVYNVIVKAYIDYESADENDNHIKYQNVKEIPSVNGVSFGSPVFFVRPRNPHSGCYFLNAGQMEYWAKQPYFLDRDTGFVGPLESAATLGIMRTFRVYKPEHRNADFLEIQHYGNVYASKLINMCNKK